MTQLRFLQTRWHISTDCLSKSLFSQDEPTAHGKRLVSLLKHTLFFFLPRSIVLHLKSEQAQAWGQSAQVFQHGSSTYPCVFPFFMLNTHPHVCVYSTGVLHLLCHPPPPPPLPHPCPKKVTTLAAHFLFFLSELLRTTNWVKGSRHLSIRWLWIMQNFTVTASSQKKKQKNKQMACRCRSTDIIIQKCCGKT